jgi:hypothetical protein
VQLLLVKAPASEGIMPTRRNMEAAASLTLLIVLRTRMTDPPDLRELTLA